MRNRDTESMILTGPAATGKTMMLRAITDAINGDFAKALYLNGANLRSERDVAALFSEEHLAQKVGDQPLIIHVDEADKLSHDMIELLARTLLPLYTKRELNGVSRKGAIVTFTGNDEAKTSRLFDRINELAGRDLTSIHKPSFAYFEPHTKDSLVNVAERELEQAMLFFAGVEAFEDVGFLIQRSVGRHLAELAVRDPEWAQKGAQKLVYAVARLSHEMSSEVRGALPGSRIDLKVIDGIRSSDPRCATTFKDGVFTLGSLGLRIEVSSHSQVA
jgi:Cdc6-like AAA superfamily ATPase